MAQINVKDAAGNTVAIEAPNPNGRQGAAASRPVALSTEDKAALDDIAEAIGNLAPGGGSGGDASAANQVTMIDHLEGIEEALSGALEIGGTVAVAGDFYPTTQPVSGAVGIDGPVAVTGDFYPETQPISGTVGVSGTVDVAGPLTDTQLRAAAVPVAVDFPATQPVSAEALPLPTGAATAAKQDAAKASLDKLSSAKSWFAITPANNALPAVPDAIYVGGDGDLVLRGDDDEDATFAVVAGQILPVSPAQVRAATNATGLVGLVA